MISGDWNANSGENDMVSGKGHSNQIQHMAFTEDWVITCGMDDVVVFSSVQDREHKYVCFVQQKLHKM